MMKAIVLLITLLSLTQCLKRLFPIEYHKKNNEDCDLLNWCEGDLKCRDYRCKQKDAKDNQVSWAPKGIKCDKAHSCKEGTRCVAHRCEPIVASNSTTITANTTAPIDVSNSTMNTTNLTHI